MDKFYSSSFHPCCWRWYEKRKKKSRCDLYLLLPFSSAVSSSAGAARLLRKPFPRPLRRSSKRQPPLCPFAGSLTSDVCLRGESLREPERTKKMPSQCKKKKTHHLWNMKSYFKVERCNIRRRRSSHHMKIIVYVFFPPAAPQVPSGPLSFHGHKDFNWQNPTLWCWTSSPVFLVPSSMKKKTLSKWLDGLHVARGQIPRRSPAASVLPFVLWPCQATAPPHGRGPQLPDEWALQRNTAVTSSPPCCLLSVFRTARAFFPIRMGKKRVNSTSGVCPGDGGPALVGPSMSCSTDSDGKNVNSNKSEKRPCKQLKAGQTSLIVFL